MPDTREDFPSYVVDHAGRRRITIRGFLDEGRDGLIYHGSFADNPTDQLAVKFFLRLRSIGLFGGRARAVEFAADLEQQRKDELNRLASLSHPNVQQYITYGTITHKKSYFKSFDPDVEIGEKIPFLVSRLVDGSNLDKTLSGQHPVDSRQVIRWLYDVSVALVYIHGRDVLHNDIALRNIVVSKNSGRAVLVDFGISKYLPPMDTSVTRLWIDSDPLPPLVKKAISQKTDGKWQRDKLRELLFPAADLYLFALVIDACRDRLTAEQISAFDYEYLTLISSGLKNWSGPEALAAPMGQPPKMLSTAKDLVKAFERLISGADCYRQELGEGADGPRHFNRPAMTVEVRRRVGQVLDHPTVSRFRNLSQLSMLHHVYPSANQSRLDHALGALGRAQQVWQALAYRPQFRFLMESSDIHRLELVALLHDLNHFPFLHYFQELGLTSVEKTQVLEVLLQMDHPPPAGRLADLLKGEGLSAGYFSRIIRGDAGPGARPSDDIIVSIVNGGVDIDKMAYLYDDALHTGVPYGRGADYDRIIQEMDVAYVNDGEFFDSRRPRWHIVFHDSALSAVESLCWARYWNFQRIYWHPRNRAVAAMIIWVVRELFAKEKETFEGYLVATASGGDLAALDYLDSRFVTHYNRHSPLFGLSVDSTKIYTSILEIPNVNIPGVTEAVVPDNIRLAAQDKVAKQIHDYIAQHAIKKVDPDPQSGEVLLDVPLRQLGLGGPIFILNRKGEPRPVIEGSPAILNLQNRFKDLSSTVRVFVSPRLRDAVGARRWKIDEPNLTAEVVAAMREPVPQAKSEVQ